MKTMSLNDSQASRVFALLTLLLASADLIDKIIASLHPELHFLEWVACLMGAVGGQILFKANTPMRVLGGLFVGYMAGLYMGVEVAKHFNWIEPNAGRAFAACGADMLGRCVEYIFRNPREAVDFVIEKGVKLISFLGDDLIGKGFSTLKDLFTKKS
jgi:hypothetical protein